MYEQKLKLIREFCVQNSKQSNIDKYSRYFKEGFNGYGIDQKVYEAQRDSWIAEWKHEMILQNYLELGDLLVQTGKYEETSFAVAFLKSERDNYTRETFDRIGRWFDLGITNWGNTDVLCMLVISSFLIDGKIGFEDLKKWNQSASQWKRRAVPVTLVEMIKHDLEPAVALPLVEELMEDRSEYVQKGIGTLLRGLWKTYPAEIEEFMLRWKDRCGRLIIQYATEKMTKEQRAAFRKN